MTEKISAQLFIHQRAITHGAEEVDEQFNAMMEKGYNQAKSAKDCLSMKPFQKSVRGFEYRV